MWNNRQYWLLTCLVHLSCTGYSPVLFKSSILNNRQYLLLTCLVQVIHVAGKMFSSEVLFLCIKLFSKSPVFEFCWPKILVSLSQDFNSKKRVVEMTFIEIYFLIKILIKTPKAQVHGKSVDFVWDVRDLACILI